MRFSRADVKGPCQTHNYWNKSSKLPSIIADWPAKAKSRLPQGENKRASKSLLRARRIYMAPKTDGARYADLQKPPQHHDCEQAPTFRLASELSP
jgi:hypothetical protein